MKRGNSKSPVKKLGILSNYQKTTLNTISGIKNNIQSQENNNKKISKKLLEEKFSKNKMLVALRARPLLARELEESNYKTISVLNSEVVSITIPTEYISTDKGKYYFRGEKKIKVTKVKEATFKFDFAFDTGVDQAEVYQCTTANLVKQVVNGYNATVFAYGATGTGKTYTMVGEGEKWGIMVRAISDLFKIISQDDKEKKFVIKISYVEIYNEIIKDLLVDNSFNSFNNNKPLEIRTDAQKGVVLQGASFKKVTNESDAYKLIMRGNKHRTEKPSTNNENSSRSHAILQIYLEVEQQQSNNFNTEKTFGKFVLVDLAGSERAPIFGKKNTESGSINKSLLALGKCINALTSQNKGYIPWRDSKLTRLLQEPLSGNSRIVMIATVSPSIDSFDETMFTLQNANKAKGVKVVLKKNVVETEGPRINKYDEYIQNLQEEIHEINEKIVENEKINVNNISNINLNTSSREIEQTSNNNAPNININNNTNNVNIITSSNNITNINKKNTNNISPAKTLPNNTKDNTTNNNIVIQIDECEKIKKEIMDHFQKEINLKKKIIEKEEIIENLKNELCEKEYEYFHANRANNKLLKGEVDEKRADIKDKTKKINKGYIKQNELVAKRKQIQAMISKISNSEPNNPQVKNLFNIYKYYLNLLENMNTEHRKYISINEIKRKEKKIGILTEQLDLRDMYIRDAYKEIELNKCDFNYKNPKIISSEEIDLAPIRPPIVRVSPSFGSLQNLSLPKDDNTNNIKLKSKLKDNDTKSTKSSKKNINSLKAEKYKEQDEIKKLDEIKKNIVTNTKITKKRQFGNEILSLFKFNPKLTNLNNKSGFDPNLFERKKYNSPNFVFSQSQTLINAGEKAMQEGNNNNLGGTSNLRNKNSFKNSLAKDTRKNYNFRYDGNGNLIRNRKTRNYNYGNYSFSRDDSMSKSASKIEITNTSSLENEVQKKVKTILKKDYIGRYKRSPYLKLFEQ